MKEYIEREKALEAICSECVAYDETNPFACEGCDQRVALFGAPSVDVAPVIHGEWNIKSETIQMLDDVDEEIYVECPFCKRTFYVPFEFEDEKILAYARKNYPYCNCGAKMDGGKLNG